jgi:hypothetical protein
VAFSLLKIERSRWYSVKATSTDTRQQRAIEPQSQNINATAFGLVRGMRLLEIIFPEKASRPSLRSLERYVRQRIVPSVKLGRQRFYSPPQVQEALLSQQSMRGGRR